MRVMRSVVGFDGSASAQTALAWAAAREARRGGAVHLVLVLEADGQGDAAGCVTAARRCLQDATTALYTRHPALDVSAEIAIGDAPAHLARIAARDSLLVVGADRRTDPFRYRRRLDLLVVDRPVGATAVVPDGPADGRTGVLAVVRDARRAGGTLSLAAQDAFELGEWLTLVRMSDPAGTAWDDDPIALEGELAAIAHGFPALRVRIDPGWVKDPVGLLARAEGAALLVLEGHGPTVGAPRPTLERWLAGLAPIPFVVVAEAVVRAKSQPIKSDAVPVARVDLG